MTWDNKILIAIRFPLSFLIGSAIGIVFVYFLENMIKHDQFIFLLEFCYYLLVILFFVSGIWLIYKLVDYIIELKKSNIFSYIVVTLRTSIILSLTLIFTNFILPILNLSERYYSFFNKLSLISLIGIVTFILVRLILIVEKVILLKYRSQDTLKVKAIYTKTNLLRQVVIFFIIIIAVAEVLMTFEPVRQVGISLIASAGFIGVIAGFAAQKTLSTIISGLQLALTQPIKMGDSIFLNNEMGVIEEITLTYVVIKLWDLRRLVVPVNFFLENTFQNWTRNSSDLLGTVFLNVDYSMNVEDLRQELDKILNQSIYWNQKLGLMQVTEFKEMHIELRVLVSADNADNLWNLRCEVREKLLSFILKQYPNCMPVLRIKNTSA